MSIIAALPGIAPTSRTHEMEDWPQGRMKMRNGRIRRWGLVSQGSGARTDLTWENITYAQAEQVCIAWDNIYGIYGRAELPPEVFAGATGALKTMLESPGGTWQFAGPPEVSAAGNGRCTVSVTVRNRIFASYEP